MEKVSNSGIIVPSQLFYILFVSRLFSLLLSSGSVLNLAVKVLLSFLLCFLAYIVGKADVRRIRYLLYGLSAAVIIAGVIEYIAFLSKETQPDVPHWAVVLLLAIAVFYAARLGIQPLARFSAFCMVLLVIGLLLVVISNLKGVHLYHLKATDTEIKIVWYEWISLLDLPLLYLLLQRRCNDRTDKPLFWSVTSAGVAALLIYSLCLAVMGTAVRHYDYPVFHLFQLAGIGSFTRLDIFMTGNELLGLFLQSAVLISAAATMEKERKREKN